MGYRDTVVCRECGNRRTVIRRAKRYSAALVGAVYALAFLCMVLWCAFCNALEVRTADQARTCITVEFRP